MTPVLAMDDYHVEHFIPRYRTRQEHGFREPPKQQITQDNESITVKHAIHSDRGVREILTYSRYSAAEKFAVVQIDVPSIGDDDVLVRNDEH
jgi:hypothetical protein